MTVVVRLGPPSASRVPSPPSAIGTSSQSHPSSNAASPIALATAGRGRGAAQLVGSGHHAHAAHARSGSLLAPPCRPSVPIGWVTTVALPWPPAPPDRPIVARVQPRPGRRSSARTTARSPSKRGAGGLVSGIGPLVAEGDVTWLAAAMSDDDRGGGQRRGGRGRRVPRPAARHRPGGVPARLRRGEQRGALVRAPRAVGPHPRAGLRRVVGRRVGCVPSGEPRVRRRGGRGGAARARRCSCRTTTCASSRPGCAARGPTSRACTSTTRPSRRRCGSAPCPTQRRTSCSRAWPPTARAGSTASAGPTTSARSARAARRARAHRRSWRRSRPIPADIRAAAASPECAAALAALEEVVQDRLVIGRVDRVELSKNILRGFQAYGELLEAHPEHRERVVFVANAYASRTRRARLRRLPGAGRARGPRHQRAVRHRRLAADRARRGGRLPSVGRAAAAGRRAAGEPDPRRPQPRRLGGRAGERARRRARPVAGGGRVGAPRRRGPADAAVRRGRHRGGAPPGARDARRRASRPRRPPARDRRGPHPGPLARRPARRRGAAQRSAGEPERASSAPSGPVDAMVGACASERLGHVRGAHGDLDRGDARARPAGRAPRRRAGRPRRRRCRPPTVRPSERSSTTVPLSTVTGGCSSSDILAARRCSPVRAAAAARPRRRRRPRRRAPAGSAA